MHAAPPVGPYADLAATRGGLVVVVVVIVVVVVSRGYSSIAAEQRGGVVRPDVGFGALRELEEAGHHGSAAQRGVAYLDPKLLEES